MSGESDIAMVSSRLDVQLTFVNLAALTQRRPRGEATNLGTESGHVVGKPVTFGM